MLRLLVQPSFPSASQRGSFCTRVLGASRQFSIRRSIHCCAQPASRAAFHHAYTNGTAPPRPLDAIMVLGGGYNMDGTLPPWVHRRLDLAHDLYQQQSSNTRIVCLGGGTPHKPTILDSKGYALHEATMCAEYLMTQRGVPAPDLLKEIASYDTVGNAYFSLVIHAVPAQWRQIAVVTSQFHMPRTRQLFQDIYSIGAASMYGDPGWFELHFHSASDEGIFDQEALEARVAKEAKSISNWLASRKAIDTLASLHAWLHDTHLCYAVSRQQEFGVTTIKDPKLLASY